MNRFNLIMSIAIVVVAGFFGIGIIQKANYKIAAGDTVYVTYSMTAGEDTYENRSANVVVGNNDDKIITDDLLLDVKNGSNLSFNTKLTEDVVIDDETTVKTGTEVIIDGKISDVTPKADEVASAEDTEVSEVTSETK